MLSLLQPSPPKMHLKTLIHHPHFSPRNPNLQLYHHLPPTLLLLHHHHRHSSTPSFLRSSSPIRRQNRLKTACISPSQEIVSAEAEFRTDNGGSVGEASSSGDAEEVFEVVADASTSGGEFSADESLWNQLKEIVMFAGPAAALWLCGPTMSLIDTAVIGQGSSLELAALGPGTVLCDYLGYVFMFLSIGTSNMVATSLAREGKKEVQHKISMFLFIALVCGILMLIFTKLLGAWTLTAFTGVNNVNIVPAANTYIQIRGLAWPAVLVGMVAQSASLGMKDSWGPLKALAVASAVNAVGDVILCTFMGYGIAGAAWATMASQVIGAYMMIEALNRKGYNAYSFSIPSPTELLQIFKLAAPVFITMMSKVLFYSLIVYFATSMGTQTVAAHQVMAQMYTMCTVWGEPLSQTAQSFMPELIYGINQNLAKAQMLLRSLVIIGAISGLVLGAIGTSIPWLFPNLFTPDHAVIHEMHNVLIPYFLALVVTPSTHSLEGTLLAGREFGFLSASMTGCFCLGGLLLWFLSNSGFGLPGCWSALVGFQWARFSLALWRLISPDGILRNEDLHRQKVEKLKAT